MDEKEKTNAKKEDVLEKDKKEKTPEQANQEIPTIMPTMIDESEEIRKVRDLSAIIPKSDNNTPLGADEIELISKDNDLKSDGSAVIATIDDNGEATIRANLSYPEQIDIEARKEEKIKLKTKKKKKEKIKPSKVAQKFQNSMALFSLIVIIALGSFWYYITHAPTEKDFKPLTVEIELGEKLPIRTSSYVEPGKGEIDELLYALDTSNVKLEEAGEYEFTVTYKGITKTGKIIIKDTTKPLLEVRPVYVVEGGTYNAASFVESCIDWSGCNYSFQNSETEQKYTTPGSYVVYVVATDAYQNSVTKQASLIIEARGNVKKYYKNSGFLYDAGYEVEESYELHFYDYADYSILLNGTYTTLFKYQDEVKYEEARKQYYGEVNYTCLDSELTIKRVESVTVIGSNYSKKTDIENYLNREGFQEIG